MESLVTLDQPDPSYKQRGIMDMEASGFFSTACRFGSAELIQVLKVISDNRRNDARGINANQACLLMEDAMETLDLLLATLDASVGSRRSPTGERQDG